MKILAIDTSCDETAAAVTENTKVLSNTIWSQASLHAKFGGVMPSLAQREHEEHIDWVIEKALKTAKTKIEDVDAIAVTVGPGLSIALGVGIDRARKLSIKYQKPVFPINHIEAHLLSPFANNVQIPLPALGLVVSGGNTQLVNIKDIGEYEILAETQDDALGEALDKGARLLGLGYPGGAVLELLARSGDSKSYKLPVPLVGDKVKNRFSYSGLKTAFVRLVASTKNIGKKETINLAASFQEVAFAHIIKVVKYQLDQISELELPHFLLLGGGVANNTLLKSKLRKLLREYKIKLLTPYSKKLLGDNAAMIGVCAYLKYKGVKDLAKHLNLEAVDRKPGLRIV